MKKQNTKILRYQHLIPDFCYKITFVNFTTRTHKIIHNTHTQIQKVMFLKVSYNMYMYVQIQVKKG